MFSVKIKRKSNIKFKLNTLVQATGMSERTATFKRVTYLCKGYFP